jgi:hypothetical protein
LDFHVHLLNGMPLLLVEQADDEEDMQGTKKTGSKGREARRIRVAAQTEVCKDGKN